MTKLSPGQRWWFHACSTCNRGTIPFGAAYKCPDKKCDGVGATSRYRLCYLGSDDTDEIELVFFEKTGKEMIGKPSLTLLRSRVPRGMSLDEAIQFGCTDQTIPRELAAIVSRKFRLVVSVTSRSFEPEAPKKPSYQVHRIDVRYGRQPHSSTVCRAPGLALASSSSSSGGGLNSLGEALVDNLMTAQTTSPGALSDLSDAPASNDIAGSMVGSEVALPHNPPSIATPPGLSGDKGVVNSSVQRALFQEPSPPRESGTQLDSAPQADIGLALVGDPNPPPATSVASSEEKINTRCYSYVVP